MLMERYARGDLDAFEELYRRYERRVYGFCLRFLGDPDGAADAFQDVFLRLIGARHKYEARGRFAQWIFAIARRVCVDGVRGSRREAYHDDSPRAAENTVGVDPVESFAYKDALQRLLQRMPAEQREVLLLSRYYGFKYGEIAEMTGSTEAAVKQKAYRAVQSIRRTRRDETGRRA